jgi:hypothetical protein
MNRALLALTAIVALGCGGGPAAEVRALDAGSEPEEIRLVPRSLTLDSHPCSQCHDKVKGVMTGRRPATHRYVDVKHMPGATCTTCHDLEDMESLVLLGGGHISIDNSGALCGQCHFREHGDWELGLHGKNVGKWQGRVRDRYQCVGCHDAHAPAFPMMKPLAPPARPRLGVEKGHH